jgi:hypothetical protein
MLQEALHAKHDRTQRNAIANLSRIATRESAGIPSRITDRGAGPKE